MHYADLDIYEYGKIRFPEVKRVGWLEPGFPYTKTSPNRALVNLLYSIVYGKHRISIVVDPVKGWSRPCNFCGFSHHDIAPSELWIPERDGASYFSAPSLLMHYIEEHNYGPPEAFLTAVESLDLDGSFRGEEICQSLMNKHGYSLEIGENILPTDITDSFRL